MIHTLSAGCLCRSAECAGGRLAMARAFCWCELLAGDGDHAQETGVHPGRAGHRDRISERGRGGGSARCGVRCHACAKASGHAGTRWDRRHRGCGVAAPPGAAPGPPKGRRPAIPARSITLATGSGTMIHPTGPGALTSRQSRLPPTSPTLFGDGDPDHDRHQHRRHPDHGRQHAPVHRDHPGRQDRLRRQRVFGTVTPIATATNTAGTPITTGNDPDAIAITPDGSPRLRRQLVRTR